ncbi:MAG: class I SAM-dependent methyltransferase [Oligoflexia bacterium]|nr:class I SAM-dependent methyltransferase [Oligoflexia bacterium]
MKKYDKYALYEVSVQSPDTQVDIYLDIYNDINKKKPRHFREDFCSTFILSLEWVKRHKSHTAVGIDLDSEPLRYGKKMHLSKLSTDQKKRMRLLRQNVISVTKPKADIIGVGNFSFYIFQKRDVLIEYFKCCLKSLQKKGIIVLEMAGGPGTIEQRKETKTVKMSRGKKFKYIWDQKSFDPIPRQAHYAIHFKFADGSTLKNAFTYDWRVWTIPEVREALYEAGFSKTYVYWDQSDSGNSYDYLQTEKATNDHAWVSQIVGVK